MSEELEIEFKNLLNKSEYVKLLSVFHANETDFFSQENHYFDTIDGQLRKMNAGLRIRILPQKAELTLKTPFGLHLLETTDDLSLEDATGLLEADSIKKDGIVGEKLKELEVPLDALHCFGSLKTVRFEKTLPEGLLVLDKSMYAGKVDYELEFEAQEHNQGLLFFNQFLETYSIPKRVAKNKIIRMKDALDGK